MTEITLQSARSEPRNPAEAHSASPNVDGKWHHVRLAHAVFWLTDLQGEVIDTYNAFFGANYWVWALGNIGEPYEGYAFACDAAGRVGVIPANALAPGWRPNALVRRAD